MTKATYRRQLTPDVFLGNDPTKKWKLFGGEVGIQEEEPQLQKYPWCELPLRVGGTAGTEESWKVGARLALGVPVDSLCCNKTTTFVDLLFTVKTCNVEL